jgi:hypothetical protein
MIVEPFENRAILVLVKVKLDGLQWFDIEDVIAIIL